MHDEVTTHRPIIVCLHGSASDSGMWREFKNAVRGRATVITPDLVGYGTRRFDHEKGFTLQDEIDAVLEQVGDSREPFHLVGHAYGGTVATCLAKRHPERIASLILYEPANYALLFAEGLHTPAAREIHALRLATGRSRNLVARWRGARNFISYWADLRSWQRLSITARICLSRYMPKVVAEFEAMLASQQEMGNVGDLRMPVRILCGTHTRPPARRVAEIMVEQLDDVRLLRLVDLRHMAPVTHPHRVNPIILDYVLPVAMPEQTQAT